WQQAATERYPHGLPKPYSNDPTQWIFHGHPCGSVIWDDDAKCTTEGLPRIDTNVLQIAVARLLGYRWPAETDAEMELADEARAWVSRCDALAAHADRDGIVCLPPVGREKAAADRLLNLLAAAYGPDWSNDVLAQLLASAGHAGKSLESWLRETFFAQHCELFHQRPFIWHIWDGLRDGFAALVNYHHLDTKTLEALIYTHLGDWITRQSQDLAAGVDGAQEKLHAAQALKQKLELILKGEQPHDIFVRWKPLDQQPIGWDPDLNDGVRLNIRPFLSVPDVGKKGAGVLRDRPKVKWDKDRGKDVESAPWYHLGPKLGGKEGDRINDHHLSLAEKRAARNR
ncbi:MAG: SAM-dependent DNA methyltransferase, partial [Achromobacter sp.]|nr:SAM-dependent DNA methyltransferase [Achromobacter sp.]